MLATTKLLDRDLTEEERIRFTEKAENYARQN
jgi:hypothetical protein